MAHNDTMGPCINNYLEIAIFHMGPRPFTTLYAYESLISLYLMLSNFLLEVLEASDSNALAIFKR